MAIRDQTEFAGLDSFVWFFGVVEDRNDPLNVGRVRVRCYGWHDANRTEVPVESLPWAQVMMPINSASISGIGFSSTGIVEGTTVIGFFMDGKNAQQPLILGTIPGISTKASGENDEGFQDPNNKYPLETGFPDTPKLAYDRWQEDDMTRQRAEMRKTEIATASGSVWSEPAYRENVISLYPYNHVRRSESGHTFEVDDTENNERLLERHASGTFYEILPDGSRVTKIVGTDYSIVVRDKNVLVEGKCSVTINGDADVLVNGNRNELVNGSYNLTVKGQHTITAAVTNINNDLNIEGISSASGDHVSAGISGKGHVHKDSKGLGSGRTSKPR